MSGMAENDLTNEWVLINGMSDRIWRYKGHEGWKVMREAWVWKIGIFRGKKNGYRCEEVGEMVWLFGTFFNESDNIEATISGSILLVDFAVAAPPCQSQMPNSPN